MKRIFLIVKTWVQHLCEMPSRHPKDTRRAVRLERLAARRPFAGDLTLPPGNPAQSLPAEVKQDGPAVSQEVPPSAVPDGATPPADSAADAPPDQIQAVQRRPLREANRLELWPYASLGIGDPYLQRVGGGLRALWHLREGAALGLDASGMASFETQELSIAKRELRARVIESRERAAVRAVGSIAPLYGKVSLPGDAILHFEIFADAALGGAFTQTDAGSGLRPLVGAGLGERLLLGSNVALTARVGGEVYAERVLVNGQTTTHAMGFWSVQLGLSFYFGSGGER